jgi:hypothetical protein
MSMKTFTLSNLAEGMEAESLLTFLFAPSTLSRTFMSFAAFE